MVMEAGSRNVEVRTSEVREGKMEGKQIECGGFTFLSNFDSANLSRVELVTRKPAVPPEPPSKPSKKPNAGSVNQYPKKKTKSIEFPDYEFNIWTNPDCSGTEFENGNRTWFYFGITGGTVFSLVKLNIIDLNKQSKMYSQGMAPVYKIVPGKCQWERIRDKPVFTSENNVFTLSFKFRTTENVRAITYFAFTYPFSYTDLQKYLGGIDLKMSKQQNHLPKSEIKSNKGLKIINDINDAIYYHREVLCHSLEKRDVDLITISSHHNITAEREPRLEGLFPNENTPRPFKFQDKKVIFISARVHPGETPSSFVMNGILNLLIQKDDPIAILLRRQFVFKLIPMLNPDGVARGHYRTDTRGCNLNRYYLNPSRELHPSVYGARALIRYHHFGEETVDDFKQDKLDVSSQVDPNELSESDISSVESPKPSEIPNTTNVNNVQTQISDLILADKQVLNVNLTRDEFLTVVPNSKSSTDLSVQNVSTKSSSESVTEKERFVSIESSEEDTSLLKDLLTERDDERAFKTPTEQVNKNKSVHSSADNRESGLFLYLDMHGHASKKGVFMYGNHFNKTEDSVECMLFPKLMSVNSQNFHFPACNFTEKNMYLRDKRDGTSREGSGRVAVLRLTGLIRSYTLECNYNTGRFVNKLPQCSRDLPGKSNTNLIVPPKYSPVVYEEIGRALCISILDLTNSNPWSRIPNSEYHTLFGIRDWLRLKTISESFLYHRPVPRQQSKQPSKSSQTQVMMGVVRSGKLLSNVLLTPLHSKQSGSGEPKPEDLERKENLTTYRGTSCNSLVMNRKEAGPSHVKRTISRVSSVLQVRTGGSRSMKSLKKTIYRSGEKLQKLKQFGSKAEGNIEEPSGDGENRVTHCENERRGKVTNPSEQCLFKQSPKRLKISKGDEGGKPNKVSDWSKEDAIPGTSSSDMLLYSRLNRPVSSGEGQGKKRTTTTKGKQQLSSVKFKKSLEKRRGSDASRKKSKTLFKKSGKIILTNDSNKGTIDRKRRKN